MAKRALITGITGQDGAYLAKLLLEKGYEVFGAVRRSSSLFRPRLQELGIESGISFLPFDLGDFGNMQRTIEQVAPDEIYNLAAQSFVTMSFEQPVYTAETTAVGVTRLLEVLRHGRMKPRFYQASSSEMFGKVRQTPQREDTPFYPRSPYGVAKTYAHFITINYREAYNLHACSGILFNHESPLRGMEFVTRKVTLAFARIRHGKQDVLDMGNLDAQRDWGFAGDYVDGMWRMLQQEKPEDYVLATGKARSVREFVELVARLSGYDLVWKGTGLDETGVDRKSGRTLVRIDPAFFRASEVDLLIGAADKAAAELDWRPTTTLEQLAEMMVKADIDRVSRDGVHF